MFEKEKKKLHLINLLHLYLHNVYPPRRLYITDLERGGREGA